ncbi:hypothetical protein C1H46_029598 [Malus baccata]|uniref:Uncharacterized protein n=1 Tax=Malus baccata TaxID=106549 RepID=A0A540LEF0_MALBA|nr:hypothetical protein C1H46_029598 [Malus baccata]
MRMTKIEEEPMPAERQKTTSEGRYCEESETQTREDKQWQRNQGCRSLIKGAQYRVKQEITIKKAMRNKRKCITAVKGLQLFDLMIVRPRSDGQNKWIHGWMKR